MPFCTAAEVKTHIGISGSTHDTKIAQYIDGVDAFITKKTGVKTGATLSTDLDITDEIHDGFGLPYLFTKYHPINSVDAVYRRLSDFTFEDYTTDAGTIEYDGNKVFTQYLITGKGERNIKIDYNAGYLTADVPEDLKLAAIMLVAFLFNSRNATGIKNQSVLGVQMTLEQEIENNSLIRKILKKYSKVYAL